MLGKGIRVRKFILDHGSILGVFLKDRNSHHKHSPGLGQHFSGIFRGQKSQNLPWTRATCVRDFWGTGSRIIKFPLGQGSTLEGFSGGQGATSGNLGDLLWILLGLSGELGFPIHKENTQKPKSAPDLTLNFYQFHAISVKFSQSLSISLKVRGKSGNNARKNKN